MGLIQTSDQLFFSYQAIIEGTKLLNDPVIIDCDLSEIDDLYSHVFLFYFRPN